MKLYQLFFLTILTFQGIVAKANRPSSLKENFICGYKSFAEYGNSIIHYDRRSALLLRELFRAKTLSPDERQELISILIKYHLIPIRDESHIDCRFYSYLCADKHSLHEVTLEYLRQNPQGPEFCHIYDHGEVKAYPFLSEECERAIESRIQVIPLPLVLAQAGLESQWGNSRFATTGYNFFGIQTTFASSANTQGNPKCMPAQKNPRKCVYKFDSVEQCFFTYSLLLNSSPVYIEVRHFRSLAEQETLDPCQMSLRMAQGLRRYATDPNYIKKVQKQIKNICQIIHNC